jgi:hypothetical protein
MQDRTGRKVDCTKHQDLAISQLEPRHANLDAHFIVYHRLLRLSYSCGGLRLDLVFKRYVQVPVIP